MISLKLVSQKGDYIISNLEHKKLFENWFDENDIVAILKSLDYRLIRRFLNNMDKIIDDTQSKLLIKLLFYENDGLLNDPEFINTPKALLIQEHFTVKTPLLVLENIEKSIDTIINE